ncbi:MAG: class I adenylate-forming enzyme family protein [Suilimivivens sp.]
MFQSIVDAVEHYAHSVPDKPCVIDEKGEYSYGDIWKQVKRIASYYQSKELKKGNCIAVECTQDARFLICDLACQLTGMIFVPIEHRAVQERCSEILHSVDARLLICETDYETTVRKRKIGDLFESAPKEIASCDVQERSPNDVAEILYTTGTTGKPKGIVITNRNNVSVAENIMFGTEMKKENVELIPLPLSHSHGLRTCYANFINGSTVVLVEGVMRIKDVFDLMERYKVTALDLSPSAAKVLLKLSKGKLKDYREQIDFVEIGTAMLGEELKNELCDTLEKSRLYNFYGSTEAGRACILDFNKERGMAGCIGRPTRHAKFVVTDQDRNMISSSKENMGLLAIAGDMTMKEYWKDEKTTEQVMSDGLLYTNDLGYIDVDGKVYVLGRVDDVINYKGIKIAPEEIEVCALRHKDILDCACVPVPDKMCGQVPKLFVVARDRENFDTKKYVEFLTAVLDSNRVPKKIEVVDAIPRTMNGKIQRKKLMEE